MAGPTPAPMPASMPYLPQLDGVRALAVLVVFLAHAGFHAVVPGSFGVTVFFFLSGYLITTLLRIEHAATGGTSLPAFYLRRSLRILPPLYLALGLAWGLSAAGLLHWGPVDPLGILGQALLVTNYPDWLGTERVLPVPLWSLAIEEHFYLAFPLAFALWLGRARPGRAALVCAAACLVVLGLRGWNVWRLPDAGLNYSWTHTRIDAILFGCCLGFWNNPVVEGARAWRPRPWQVAASLLVVLATLAVRDETFRQTLRYSLQSAALFVPFAALLHGRGRIAGWLAAPPLRWLGLRSYSFYLVHMAMVALVQHLAPGLPPAGLVPPALALGLALAALSHRFVERPCARLRRRLLAGTGRPPEPLLGARGRTA